MQTNILDWLEATSARCPDAPAVGDDQTDCTWAQLADTARRAGSFLASRTMSRRPVAFYLEKSVSAFAAMLGTVYAGCCYSVLDTRQPAARTLQVLDTLAPAFLVTDEAHAAAAATLGYSGQIFRLDDLLAAPADAALLAARRSKDPNTQVGACIVSPDNIILSTGYNGLPCSCSDDVFPWEREGAETKYPYVVHAELNAILNAGGRVLRGARLYVALFPCNECAKAIIQSGIREIIYFSDKYAETANIRASKRMLDAAGVRYHPLQTELASITLDFRAPESAGIPQKSDADEK